MCEIEISHMGKNNGNPNLVCGKELSQIGKNSENLDLVCENTMHNIKKEGLAKEEAAYPSFPPSPMAFSRNPKHFGASPSRNFFLASSCSKKKRYVYNLKIHPVWPDFSLST